MHFRKSLRGVLHNPDMSNPKGNIVMDLIYLLLLLALFGLSCALIPAFERLCAPRQEGRQ